MEASFNKTLDVNRIAFKGPRRSWPRMPRKTCRIRSTSAVKFAVDRPGHAQYMPSHIYSMVGMWQPSIESNLASVKVANEYAAQSKLDGVLAGVPHAYDFMEYAHLQLGQRSFVVRPLDLGVDAPDAGRSGAQRTAARRGDIVPRLAFARALQRLP